MRNDVINVFAETPIINGYSRSIIYDLPRREFFFVPNSLYNMFFRYNKKSLKELFENYSEQRGIVNEYLKYLRKKEIIFLSTQTESKFFPKLSAQWDYPGNISNSIIEVNLKNFFQIAEIIDQLSINGCHYIQFFGSSILPIEYWDSILEKFKVSTIKSIDIYTEIEQGVDLNCIRSLVKKHRRLKLFFIFFAKDVGYIEKEEDSAGLIYQSTQKMSMVSSCGKINHNYFNVNIEVFTESQHYNTCLNRKICIDSNGEIKNCPAMKQSFGNIKDTTLEEAINKPGFKDLWGIRKDDIDVCKDCEFRYMCTDCRAFIKDPMNIYSQPAKCPYNPYVAKWDGEDGYITVEQWRSENPNWEKKAKRKPLVKNPQPVE